MPKNIKSILEIFTGHPTTVPQEESPLFSEEQSAVFNQARYTSKCIMKNAVETGYKHEEMGVYLSNVHLVAKNTVQKSNNLVGIIGDVITTQATVVEDVAKITLACEEVEKAETGVKSNRKRAAKKEAEAMRDLETAKTEVANAIHNRKAAEKKEEDAASKHTDAKCIRKEAAEKEEGALRELTDAVQKLMDAKCKREEAEAKVEEAMRIQEDAKRDRKTATKEEEKAMRQWKRAEEKVKNAIHEREKAEKETAKKIHMQKVIEEKLIHSVCVQEDLVRKERMVFQGAVELKTEGEEGVRNVTQVLNLHESIKGSTTEGVRLNTELSDTLNILDVDGSMNPVLLEFKRSQGTICWENNVIKLPGIPYYIIKFLYHAPARRLEVSELERLAWGKNKKPLPGDHAARRMVKRLNTELQKKQFPYRVERLTLPLKTVDVKNPEQGKVLMPPIIKQPEISRYELVHVISGVTVDFW